MKLNTNIVNLKAILFWIVIYCALFIFLEYGYKFHFYFYEQKYLFLFSSYYAFEKIFALGGIVDYLAAFFVQFFVYPYAGSAIVSALLIGTGILTQLFLKKAFTTSNQIFLFPLLPLIAILFIQFDFNYQLQGKIAYLLMLLALYGYVQINSLRKRLVVGAFIIPLLYITAGSVATLFTFIIVIWELLNKQPHSFYILLLAIELIIMGVMALYSGSVGEHRFFFLPDAYYPLKQSPFFVIYFSWIVLPCIVVFTFRIRKISIRGKGKYVAGLIQIVVLIGILYWGLPRYSDRKSIKMKELDHYACLEEWDKIMDASKGKLNNYLYLNYLNMALANKGILADRIFDFDQRGVLGLIVNWNKSAPISALLSDVYFSMGAIGLSQEMAFEGYVGSENARLLKRLIQTNILNGAYLIAEKYISILEKTLYYKEWATKQRQFLYNDSAVCNDSLLGMKRKCLPRTNTLAQISGIDKDLMEIIETTSSHKATIQYLGAIYLLGKDLKSFRDLIERYYGSESLPILPTSFQQAVIVYAETETSYWKRYGVEDLTIKHYQAYKQTLLKYKGRSDLKAVMFQSFGNTLWYYLMFKQ